MSEEKEKKPTKKALLEAFRAEMGHCRAMIEEARECTNWGIDRVDGRAYCGLHLNSVFLAADAARRATARKNEVDARIDAYMAWTAAHPAITDRMPR